MGTTSVLSRQRGRWWALLALVGVVGLGYVVYARWYCPGQQRRQAIQLIEAARQLVPALEHPRVRNPCWCRIAREQDPMGNNP